VVFIAHQQVENHLLQPLIYGRTVQFSPLMVLISILLAGSIAGIIGALLAIPNRGVASGGPRRADRGAPGADPGALGPEPRLSSRRGGLFEPRLRQRSDRRLRGPQPGSRGGGSFGATTAPIDRNRASLELGNG
jgi:AI-2E family transporter